MRGKGPVLYAGVVWCGITPAYAGKSTQRAWTYGHGGDHPRLCGEKGDVDLEWVEKTGSPPPMRGKADPCDTAGF